MSRTGIEVDSVTVPGEELKGTSGWFSNASR